MDEAVVTMQNWGIMNASERIEHFYSLQRSEAEDLFLSISPPDQLELLLSVPYLERRSWLRFLEPDDAADLIQEAEDDDRPGFLALLDAGTQKEVTALLAYAQDQAGGLMNPRFARVRPDMTVDEAIRYLRRQAPTVETIHYGYVLDHQQVLLGIVSLRAIFSSEPNALVADVMSNELIVIPDSMNQDEMSVMFSKHDLVALPVVDELGVMKGIITFDDVADVLTEEATEDIQKMGGTAALDLPYIKTRFLEMVKKRVGWLTILFFSEMLTATAMGYYESSIARMVVLALFIPLIISSGGNSGSQAATLVIRAMALGEIRLKDWWRVLRREVGAGLLMGSVLGAIGFCRILVWQKLWGTYGPHYLAVAITIFFSLIGVVAWGAISGAMLPFVLRKFKFDPASASTPFVATLVDVTGLVIYFSVANVVMSEFMR